MVKGRRIILSLKANIHKKITKIDSVILHDSTQTDLGEGGDLAMLP